MEEFTGKKSTHEIFKQVLDAVNRGRTSLSSINQYIAETKNLVDYRAISQKLAYGSTHGYLIRYGDPKKPHYQLTDKGISKLSLLRLKSTPIKTDGWDGNWRFIIFDVPEKDRELRDKLRYSIKSLGFKKLQNSVWVIPFECKRQFKLLKAIYPQAKHLVYLESKPFDLADEYKKFWSLN